jgi:hypothetical protein
VQPGDHRIVRDEPWKRQVLWLVATALLIGGASVVLGVGTSVAVWIGIAMIVLAVALALLALLLRARVRRAMGATGSSGSRG